MPVEMQTVNVNRSSKNKKRNPVHTGTQIGAALGVSKLGIDLFKGADRIQKATNNGFFEQLGQKIDELCTAQVIDSELKKLPLQDINMENINQINKRSALTLMVRNSGDLLEKSNTDKMVSLANEIGIKAKSVNLSKGAKIAVCGTVFGIFALISAGIGGLIGAAAGKLVDMFQKYKETEKQEIIKQVKEEIGQK